MTPARIPAYSAVNKGADMAVFHAGGAHIQMFWLAHLLVLVTVETKVCSEVTPISGCLSTLLLFESPMPYRDPPGSILKQGYFFQETQHYLLAIPLQNVSGRPEWTSAVAQAILLLNV